MNILIVDDEREQIQSLSVGLRANGFRILEAVNGLEAFKYFDNQDTKVDIIITDYAMPGMNGMELLKRVRKIDRSLPVIMMTAYGEKELVIEALRNHCDGFIEKPFSLEQLIEEIWRAEIHMIQNTNSHRFAEVIPRLVHQINNPLMSIMGMAELGMLQVDDPAGVKKRMSAIIRATKKIRDINTKMMKIGQSIEGSMKPIDVREIVEECLLMFSDLMVLKGIVAEKELDCGVSYVVGNGFGLEQLFKNLILNAIDSMDGRAEKRLRVRAEVDRNNSSFLVSIEDTGCGISEEMLSRIFDAYFTSKKNGTGLGLSVVRGVVEKHKGDIEVESQLGKGTIFRIRLPITVPDR